MHILMKADTSSVSLTHNCLGKNPRKNKTTITYFSKFSSLVPQLILCDKNH